MGAVLPSTLRGILLYIFSGRTLALLRWDLHFVAVRITNALFLRKQKLLRIFEDAASPKYLNLGSGPRGLANPNWINVDGYADTNVHYLMDFARCWPLPDNSIDGIFCEHVFEHFNLTQGEVVLRECLRVLRPGGCIRIIVPDGEKIMRLYFTDA